MPDLPFQRNNGEENESDKWLDEAATKDHVGATRAEELAAIIDDYVRFLREGNAPNRTKVIEAHPKFARELDECLAGVEFIHTLEPEDKFVSKRIGGFQVIREIGRGGMGAVYEATELSLGRTVALKVLRFSGVADREALDRFRREAETVANLHHTNIVPIYSVGREDGISYYAMQLISGKSLDHVARESNDNIDIRTVADWGLQAAEALAHAHERDVIHRDVKPSNLILDGEGRIWLSDFGLAKRMDDVTLSITGALLGTPRYMSPEQAEATTNTIDHRSDIYSLGATLYELVTGQPVFAANTPHGVINQILTHTPIPPRKHRKDLSRDFETILLKCLSKQATQRYSTARDLVEDLRAIVEDRPIRARRPRLLERSKRWIRERKRSVAVACSAALITTAVFGLLIGGQYLVRKTRQATLLLTTRSRGLIAEVDSRNVPTIVQALPTHEPLEIQSGVTAIHISGDGQLSQRLQIAASPGDHKKVQISIDDQRIGMTIPVERSFRLVHFSDGVDPVLLNNESIQRWDAETDSAVWTLDMQQPTGQSAAEIRKISWPWRLQRSGYSTNDSFDQQPFVLGQFDVNRNLDAHRNKHISSQPVDLDNDGEVDVLIASRESAWLLAISGRTGKVLWITDRNSASTSPEPLHPLTIVSAVLAPPLTAGDLNDDGTADVIAMFGNVESGSQHDSDAPQLSASTWIEAISGKTGESLWRSNVEQEWLLPTAAMNEVPYAFRWFVELTAGSSSRGSGANRSSDRSDLRWRSRGSEYIRTGQYCMIADAPRIASLPASNLTPINNQASDTPLETVHRALVFVAGSHVVSLDLQSGEQLESCDTGFVTGTPARFADMDGDGLVEVVLCKRLPSQASNAESSVLGKLPKLQVAVWSIKKDRMLWQRDFIAHWPKCVEQNVPTPEWPLVDDLDGDGDCELLIPNGTTSSENRMPGPQAPWGELAAVDGSTGDTLWQRRIFTLDQQIDHFVAGPDVNGDGTREVFIATLWGGDHELYVDAISGADGRSLWRQQYSPNDVKQSQTELRVGCLTWWGGGKDGWPQLTVSLHPNPRTPTSPRAVCFSAGDGSRQQIARGSIAVWSGDVNRDGVGDLCTYTPAMEGVRQTGELSLYSGIAREYWRRLSDRRFPVYDLNGDGIRDLIDQVGNNRLAAMSGKSGETLWTTKVATDRLRQFSIVSQQGDSVAGIIGADAQQRRDFDRDGTPDLLIGFDAMRSTSFSPIHAVSGRTGKTLWQADVHVTVCRGFPMTLVRDLDGDGQCEIAIVGAMNLGYANIADPGSQSPNQVQLWLVVISADDGSVQWKRPLSPAYGITPQINPTRLRVDMLRFESPSADLNGDGTLDFILPSEANDDLFPIAEVKVEHVAISGRDGETLWRHELPKRRLTNGNMLQVPPVVTTDLDGDGRSEVIMLEFEDTDDEHRLARTVVLEAGTGRIRWTQQREVDSTYGRIDNQRELQSRPRPIVLRTMQGRNNIGVVHRSSSTASAFELEILDHNGESLTTIPMSVVPGYTGHTLRAFAHDVDDDGLDEILFWNRRALVALRGDSTAEVVWERPLATRFNAELVGMLHQSANDRPREFGKAIAVLKQGTGDNSLIGVNAATGDVDWFCVGPTVRRANGWVVPKRIELMGNAQDLPPLCLFQFTNLSVCRQAANVTLKQPNEPTQDLEIEALSRTSAVLHPVKGDPRRLRDLPWRIRLDDNGRTSVVAVAKSAAFYCCSIVLIPLAILWPVIQRRTTIAKAIGLSSLAVITIGAGWFFGDLLVHSPESSRGRWIFAFAPLPILIFAATLLVQIARGQLRKAATWMLFTIVCSVALAGCVLQFHSSHPELALQPGERYSTTRWYLIVLWGAYLTGLVMIVVSTCQQTVHFIRPQRRQ